MANASAAATTFNLPNYVGELFLVGNYRTPFLTMIGGLTSGGRAVNGWEYPVSVEESLEAAAQPDITETASLTAPTPKTYVPTQTTNVCQIFQKQVSVSYARMSDNATLSGLSLLGNNPITDPVEHQKMRTLEQIAVDVEYTMLNGSYQKGAAATVSPAAAEKSNKMRGIIPAITTNVVAAGSAPLSRAHINTLVAAMADAGAPFKNPVIFGNSAVKQSITALYGTTPLGAAPQSRTIGGLNIQTIVTDFGEIGVAYDRFVPAGTLLIADLAFVMPVSLAVPGKGHMFYEPLSKTGAGESGQFYGQIGLAYGPEVYHGKITGLSGTTDPSQAVSINASSMSVAADAMTVTTDAVTVNQATAESGD